MRTLIRPPDNVNVLEWYWEWPFFRHVDYKSWMTVMKIDVVRKTPEIISGFCVFRFLVWWLKSVRLSLNIIVVLLSSCRMFLFSEYLISLYQLDYSICGKEYEFFSMLWHENLLCVKSPSTDFRRVQTFQLFNVCNHNVSFPDAFLHTTHNKWGCLEGPFPYQTGGV